MKKTTKIIPFLALTLLAPNNSYGEGLLDAYTNNNGAGISKELTPSAKGSPMIAEEDFNANQVQAVFDRLPAKATTKEVRYSPTSIVQVRLRLTMSTTIVLPKGEKVSRHLLGDTTSFKTETIKGFPNMISVYGTDAGTDTSYKIITENGNIYSFYLRTDPINSPQVPDLLVYIKGIGESNYDGSEPAEDQGASVMDILRGDNTYRYDDSDYLKSLPYKNKTNPNYEFAGDFTIAPSSVYDDGKFTYFTFKDMLPNDELPALFRVVDGVDQPVQKEFDAKTQILTAKTLSVEGWTLIIGDRTLCVKPVRK